MEYGIFADWFFAVRPTRNLKSPREKFMAWCARTPLLGDGPLDISIYDDVHVEFGPSADAALKKLQRSLLH